jgi:hypothetical protein
LIECNNLRLYRPIAEESGLLRYRRQTERNNQRRKPRLAKPAHLLKNLHGL